MERKHWDWYPSLLKEANGGTPINPRKAQKIFVEGGKPGRYFDGLTHMFDVINTIRALKRNPEVKAVGIFGSRLRGDHTPLHSDVDLLVINEEPVNSWTTFSMSRGDEIHRSREVQYRRGVGAGIEISECNTEYWNNTAANPLHVRDHSLEIFRSVRWLWINPTLQLNPIPLETPTIPSAKEGKFSSPEEAVRRKREKEIEESTEVTKRAVESLQRVISSETEKPFVKLPDWLKISQKSDDKSPESNNPWEDRNMI